jgi:polyphosphate glucokinase
MSGTAEPACRHLGRTFLCYGRFTVKILVVDVGGTHVKVLATGHREAIKITGADMTPRRTVREVRKAVAGWAYDGVAIGFLGAVPRGKPISEPRNLAPG